MPFLDKLKEWERIINVALIILGALLAAEVVAEGSKLGQVIGAVMMVANSLGFTAHRAYVKGTKEKARAIVEAAKLGGAKNP